MNQSDTRCVSKKTWAKMIGPPCHAKSSFAFIRLTIFLTKPSIFSYNPQHWQVPTESRSDLQRLDPGRHCTSKVYLMQWSDILICIFLSLFYSTDPWSVFENRMIFQDSMITLNGWLSVRNTIPGTSRNHTGNPLYPNILQTNKC